MSITSAKSGATGISLALENNFMEPIASTLVGSGGANQITFNDIPQTYKHLQIRGTMRNTNQNSFVIKGSFNSDTGSNYSRHTMKGTGAAVSATGEATQTSMSFDEMSPVSGNTASVFGGMIWDILDYANTNKFKTSRLLGGFDANGSGQIIFDSALWQSTIAVSSISLFMASDSFAQYSRFSLYGIRG